MVNALFVSYSGVPANPTSFLPDNGLASLAAILINNSHNAHILDYGTTSMLKRSMPEDIRSELKDMFHKKNSNQVTDEDNARIKEIDCLLTAHIDRVLEEIGQEIIKTISDKGIDFVGFKAWGGDGYNGLLKLSKIIKKSYKNIPILAGGPQIYSFKDILLDEAKHVDFLCYAEGEPTIIQFADYIIGKQKLQNVPNLLGVKNGSSFKTEHQFIRNLDDLPIPIYDAEVYPAADFSRNEKFSMIVIDESRRCYHRCPFCIESSKEKEPWRGKSASRIVDEIKNVKNKYGVSLIRFGGQMTPGYLMEDFSRQLLEEKIDVHFSSFSHISSMKNADFETMKKAGLYSLFFGVESGNQDMLKHPLGKNTKVKDIETVLKRSHDAGIYTVASIIYPAPGDNLDTMQQTLDLLQISGVDSAPVQFAGVYPSTTWANEFKKYGFDLNPEEYAHQVKDYKIKNIFPPQFWEPISVKIDGKSFSEYLDDTITMVLELESRGILSDVTDEQALLAKHAGLTPQQFRDDCTKALYTADSNSIKNLIAVVNGVQNDSASVH